MMNIPAVIPLNGNPSSQSNIGEDKADKVSSDSPNFRLKEWAQNGDVRAILAEIRSYPLDMPTALAMRFLVRAIQQKARSNVDGLIETGFSEIIALTTTLLVRCQLHVECALQKADVTLQPFATVPAGEC